MNNMNNVLECTICNKIVLKKEYWHIRCDKCQKDWMNEIKIISNKVTIDNNYILYKNIKLLFPIEEVLNKSEQCWINFTGLTTERPNIIFNEINSIIKITPNMKILDIGCGCGELAIEFYINFKKSIYYTGIDVIDLLLNINKINMKKYSFINANNFILNNNFDIVMIMGYGNGFLNYINDIIKNKIKYVILESHIGKNEDFIEYNNKLITNYDIIYNKILKCGDNWALKERRLVIYLRRI